MSIPDSDAAGANASQILPAEMLSELETPVLFPYAAVATLTIDVADAVESPVLKITVCESRAACLSPDRAIPAQLLVDSYLPGFDL